VEPPCSRARQVYWCLYGLSPYVRQAWPEPSPVVRRLRFISHTDTPAHWIIEEESCASSERQDKKTARLHGGRPTARPTKRSSGDCERPTMASLSPSLHLPWYAPSSASPLLSVCGPPCLGHGLLVLGKIHLCGFRLGPPSTAHAKCCRSTIVGR
jgi:hypothetical protein